MIFLLAEFLLLGRKLDCQLNSDFDSAASYQRNLTRASFFCGKRHRSIAETLVSTRTSACTLMFDNLKF
jgi:hypothetical protein